MSQETTAVPFAWVAHVHKEHRGRPFDFMPGSAFAKAIDERVRHWIDVKCEKHGVLIFREGFSVEWRAGAKLP